MTNVHTFGNSDVLSVNGIYLKFHLENLLVIHQVVRAYQRPLENDSEQTETMMWDVLSRYSTALKLSDSELEMSHCGDVIMSAMASQITSRLFTQSFIQAQIKENIKAPRHWPLWGEFTGHRWIPRTQKASNAENVFIWWRHHGVAKKIAGISMQPSCLIFKHASKLMWLSLICPHPTLQQIVAPASISQPPLPISLRIHPPKQKEKAAMMGLHNIVKPKWSVYRGGY